MNKSEAAVLLFTQYQVYHDALLVECVRMNEAVHDHMKSHHKTQCEVFKGQMRTVESLKDGLGISDKQWSNANADWQLENTRKQTAIKEETE